MRMKLILISIIVLLVLTPFTSALFPKSHAYLIYKQCQKSSSYSSELARMCCADVNACIAGNTLADISVIYYLEKGLKKYSVTHSDLFCTTAIDQAITTTEKALAAGICLHATGADRVSHNILVPYSIEKTTLPNYIIHPFAEQKLDDYLIAKEPGLYKIIDNSMVNALDYTDFIQRVLQPNPEYGDVNVKELAVGFIQQVKNSESGYDVSFATLKAIPTSIYIALAVILILSIVGLILIIYKTRMNFWTVTSFIFLLLLVALILTALIATLTGTVWRVFLVIASPIGKITPTQDPGLIIDQSDYYTNQLFTYGIDYTKNLPDNLQSITGVGTSSNPGPIVLAEQKTATPRLILWIVILLIIVLFTAMCILSRKKRASNFEGLGL